MLQLCFGIYIVISILTFFVIWKTFLDQQDFDEETPEGT